MWRRFKWNELLAKKKELEEKKKARREKREQKKGGEKITGEKKSQDAATPSVRLPPCVCGGACVCAFCSSSPYAFRAVTAAQRDGHLEPTEEEEQAQEAGELSLWPQRDDTLNPRHPIYFTSLLPSTPG